jgi:N-acetylglucosaminyl-diphospho-decaprenol L-rhamnosyltransferase
MSPDIVVIIVSYKCAALTIESIRSLAMERSSSDLSLRAIVVDNASGDAQAVGDAVQASGWSNWVTVHCAPFNGGFAYANNLGMKLAYAEMAPSYFYLLNPDAQVRTGAIVSLKRFLDSHPNVGIAGGSFENADGSDWPIAFRFPTLMSELLGGLEWTPLNRLFKRWVVPRRMTRDPQPIDWICGASMLIRASILVSIGGMDENYFLYFEETDFCLRAKRAGFPTWYVPESRVMHIMGQSTNVTDPTNAVKRLPSYWFESRSRYFAVNYGVAHAMAIDLAAIVANAIGLVKRLALRRNHRIVPHFIRDLIRHSVLSPRNRGFPELRNFRPPTELS